MTERIISYDFSVDSLIAVDAPYGTDPDILVSQALIKLIQRVRQNDITLVCENTFDAETGHYDEVPDEWYKDRPDNQTYSERMQDDLEPLE